MTSFSTGTTPSRTGLHGGTEASCRRTGAPSPRSTGNHEICAITLFFSTTGDLGHTFDAYVWDDTNGLPGAVLCVQYGLDPGTIAFWPSLSRHEAPLPAGCCVDGGWWCGSWGDWPGDVQSWLQAEDHDGFGGYPYTNIAPGVGYPTGWNNVSIVWGPHQSLRDWRERRALSAGPDATIDLG